MAGRTLKASVVIGGLIDQSFKTVLTDSRRGFSQLGKTIRDLKKDITSTNIEIDNAKEKGRAVGALKDRYEALKKTVTGTQNAIKSLNREEQFKNRMDRGNRQAQFMAGRATVGAFMGGGFLHNVLKESGAFQTEEARLKVMGVPDDVKKQALEAGKSLKTFGTTIRENVEMFNDGLAVFGNMKEARLAAPLMAKMKFANSALYGTSSEESERQLKDMLRVIDSRGGANNEQEFTTQANFIQKAVNASKGNVTATDFFHMMSHAGTAMRSMSNKGFFFDLLPLIQEMGGDKVGTILQKAYNGLIQGHTQKRAVDNLFNDGLIADKSKVKFDKNGNAAQLNPGALKGEDVYEKSPAQWVRSVMLPTLVEHGKISRDLYEHALKGVMSDQEKNTINTLAGGMGNDSTGTLITALVSNLAPIARDSGNAERSADVNGSVAAAKGTTKGQEQGVQAQLTNARLNLGKTIMPTYISLLQKANTALERFNGFVTTHPKLTRAMMIGTVAVTGALAVSVPLLFTAGAAMSLYGNITAITARRQALFANSQLQATRATLMGAEVDKAASMTRIGGWKTLGSTAVGNMKAVGGKAGSLVSRLRSFSVVSLLTSPFRALKWVAVGSIEAIGGALSLLLSPVGLAVAALAAVGFVVWKYWKPISAYVQGVGEGITAAFAPARPLFASFGAWIQPAIGWVKNFLTPLNSTKESLDKAGASGKKLGEWIGTGIQGAINLIGSLIDKIKWVIDKGSAVFSVLSHPQGGFWNMIRHPLETAKNIGASLEEKPDQALGSQINPNILQSVKPKDQDMSLPEIPKIGSLSARGGDTHVTNNITVHQQPGQPHDELVQEIKDQMSFLQMPSNYAPLHDGLHGSSY